jgi:PadR family transcriptional regulator, regulatory protein PadR
MVNVRREMLQGLVQLRILHAASFGPVSGVELSADLAGVGHRISPGTLYPLLHQMEKSGWVKSSGKTVKGKRRRYYRLTKKGRARLQEALGEVQQFLSGILHVHDAEGVDGLDASLTHPGVAPTMAVHAGSD